MASGKQRAGSNGSASTAQLIGRSPKIREISEVIERVAKTDIPVLICGESGSGKDVVAQLLHARSLRGHQPFLKVCCSSIPRELLESELFGYERGSFTGAVTSKPGKFELAHDGTVFLDHISEMGLSVQPKLLQVLQDMQFSRLGAQNTIAVDVRFIASTNIPLESLVTQKRFRADLCYRLNVITIQLPPLRERKEDIPELADYLLRKHAAELGGRPEPISNRLIESFAKYEWPGNVRELENTIRRILTLGEESVLLNSFPEAEAQPPEKTVEAEEEVQILSLKEVSRHAAWQAEREMILLALKKTNWNRKRAAELLNISYKAMLYKLKDAGLAKHSTTIFSS